MPKPRIFDDRACELGEGPLWHPERGQLFWFDIVNGKLLSREGDKALSWDFGRCVSAAGWIDRDTLLVASETGLSRFDLGAGHEDMLFPIEADRPETRSNDGRCDPWGGFWVGTMGKNGETGLGTLYRVAGGELRVIETGLTTPNSLCFDHGRNCAYYTDTRTRRIWRQPLDPSTGWPLGEKAVFLDLSARDGSPEHKPDGAVIDTEGCLWSAQWGSARVARYSPEGDLLATIELPTGHTSCPAFGGEGFETLFVTTARQKLPADRPDWHHGAGKTFAIAGVGRGQPECRFLI